MRKTPLVTGEYYHIFNRGVDKRSIFNKPEDLERFLQSVVEFNNTKTIGSIYEHSFNKNRNENKKELVEIVSYCFNPNHFHLLLRQKSKKGIQKFMHRLSTGYTRYFNEKNKRSGSLFQGRFKSVHVERNRQLLYLSAYINLNYKIHQLGGSTSKLVARSRRGLFKSSWEEYLGKISKQDSICEKDIILGQFKNKRGYKKFAEETVREVVKSRKEDKELEKLLID